MWTMNFYKSPRCKAIRGAISVTDPLKETFLNKERDADEIRRRILLWTTGGIRGGLYVHCVMHKCIMIKVRGKRNTHKVCKKTRKFYENIGKFCKVEGNNNFREIGGMYRKRENRGGNSKVVVDDDKKGHQKYWQMKIDKFFGKR